MFNGRPPQRLPPGSTRVGPPAHEEFIVKGPFQGFNGDMDNWHDLPLNVAQDCQNIDFSLGDIQARGGLTEQWLRTSVTGASYTSGNAYLGYAEHPETSDTVISADWTVDYSQRTALSLPTPIANKNHTRSSGTADFINGNVTVNGTLTDFLTQGRNVGGYIKANSHSSSAWTQIASVTTDTALTLVGGGYLGATTGGAVAYTIVRPIGENNVGLIVPLPTPTGGFYIGGAYGGTMFYGYSSGITAPEGFQATTDTPWYRAISGAVWGNRLWLGVISSVSTINATSTTSYYGRMIGSDNGDYRTLNGSTSVALDIDTGIPYHVFVMRDSLYIVTNDGIEVLDLTGNYQSPVRKRIVCRARQEFLPGCPPIVLDGSFAVVYTYSGPMLFDGTSLRPFANGVRERFLVNSETLYNNNRPGTGSSFYEPKRRRVYGIMSGQWMAINRDTQVPEVHKASDISGNIVAFARSDLRTSGLLDHEYGIISEEGGYTIRASITADDSSNPIGGSASNTYWKSREIKFGTGRDDDNLTVDRFRLVWEATVPNRTSTHREVAANVATITTSAAHGFATGQTVVITGLADSTYNGTRTIASTPTTTTFTYSLTHANEGTTADTGGRITPTHNVTIELFSDGGTTAVSSSTVDLSLQQDGSTVATSGLTYTKHVAVTPFTARSVVFKITQGSSNNLFRFKIKQFSIRTIRRSEGTPN